MQHQLIFRLIAIGLVLISTVFLLQILLGSVSFSCSEIVLLLLGKNDDEVLSHIIWESRVPGAIAAIAAGAALAVSGLQMQTYFRNPVAGPYVLGISSGASLGVALFYLAGNSLLKWLPASLMTGGAVIAALLGSSLMFLFNMLVAHRLRNPVAMLIIGLMIAGGINAAIDILQSFTDAESIKNYVFWTFGSFRQISLHQSLTLLAIVAAGIAYSFSLCRKLDVMLIGDTYALSSGIDLRSFRWQLLLSTSVLAGAVTAYCGPIGFVGLAVPHLAKGLMKTSAHLLLTIACVWLGAVICCICNIIAILPGSGLSIPLNAVTSILGAPFVIWIILKQR